MSTRAASEPARQDGSLTRRWRKLDSNSRSLREGKGYGEPLQASIAVSGLNLVSGSVSGSAFRAAVSEWQERDRWFESGSLQR
jgi:hypothetical protein